MVLINKIRYQLNQKIKESQNAEPVKPEKPHYSQAGAGLRSLKSTTAFRAINFELYVRPVSLFHKVINPVYFLIFLLSRTSLLCRLES